MGSQGHSVHERTGRARVAEWPGRLSQQTHSGPLCHPSTGGGEQGSMADDVIRQGPGDCSGCIMTSFLGRDRPGWPLAEWPWWHWWHLAGRALLAVVGVCRARGMVLDGGECWIWVYGIVGYIWVCQHQASEWGR